MFNLYPYQKQALSALFDCSFEEIEQAFNDLKASLRKPQQPLIDCLNRSIERHLSHMIDDMIRTELVEKGRKPHLHRIDIDPKWIEEQNDWVNQWDGL